MYCMQWRFCGRSEGLMATVVPSASTMHGLGSGVSERWTWRSRAWLIVRRQCQSVRVSKCVHVLRGCMGG